SAPLLLPARVQPSVPFPRPVRRRDLLEGLRARKRRRGGGVPAGSQGAVDVQGSGGQRPTVGGDGARVVHGRELLLGDLPPAAGLGGRGSAGRRRRDARDPLRRRRRPHPLARAAGLTGAIERVRGRGPRAPVGSRVTIRTLICALALAATAAGAQPYPAS